MENTNVTKPGTERRMRRFERGRPSDPREANRKIHRVGNDDEYENFDPNDYVKAFNAGVVLDE